jgi:BirA family biotin operon repressor/biotin-[acetyl-CoA-carboxylase] ligase
MTLLYFTRDELCDAVTVTTATAVSAACAIERATGREVGIKWVNDIYNEQGKVAGILVETASSMHGHAIAVGIGINVGECEFPPELLGIAATVGELDDEARAMMVCDICRGVLACARDHKDRGYMEYYRRAFILQDKLVDVFVDGEHELRGTVTGVSDDGALLIKPQGKDETVSLSSGNITVRIAE